MSDKFYMIYFRPFALDLSKFFPHKVTEIVILKKKETSFNNSQTPHPAPISTKLLFPLRL